MKFRVLETEDAKEFKHAAAIDARFKSAVEQQNYTPKQQAKCNAMRYALESVYSAKGFYMNYRKRFTAAIKIDDARVVNKKLLKLLEGDWDADSSLTVVKATTKQGIIYQVTVK